MKKVLICFLSSISFILLFSCNKKSEVSGGLVIVAPPVTPINNSRIYYVATNGDDTRTINQAKNSTTPWKTIQKAVNNISGGDTVIIAGGAYNESVTITSRLSGTVNAVTLFSNKTGESVIIEGGIANPNSSVVRWLSQLNISGVQYLTIKGIKVQNVNWYGIRIEASSSNVTVDGCSTINSGASGIYVNSTTNINILNNIVRKACQVTSRDVSGNGTQECITLAASSNFKVNNNEVWDSSIPGDAGGEGIDIKGGSSNGEVANNYVHDIVPLGIYLDAGSILENNIRVFNNKVVNTSGVGVAGELGGHAKDFYFYNNIISDSKSTGFSWGNTGNGRFSNIYVVNNTFVNNGKTVGFSGDIANYNTNPLHTNLVIRNNIIYNKGTNYKFSFFTNLLAPFVISNNLYFDFKQGLSGGINNFTTANLTTADVLLDPQFNNLINGDFSLKSISPAINRGIPITIPSSTILMFTSDINGKSKGTSNWDMGAFEF